MCVCVCVYIYIYICMCVCVCVCVLCEVRARLILEVETINLFHNKERPRCSIKVSEAALQRCSYKKVF